MFKGSTESFIAAHCRGKSYLMMCQKLLEQHEHQRDESSDHKRRSTQRTRPTRISAADAWSISSRRFGLQQQSRTPVSFELQPCQVAI